MYYTAYNKTVYAVYKDNKRLQNQMDIARRVTQQHATDHILLRLNAADTKQIDKFS